LASKEQFSVVDGGLLVRAPAKINLSLLIAGKRPDGFHEIETIMAKVDLYDELLFEHSDKPGIELICRGKHWAPDGEENLVYRACEQLFDAAGVKGSVKVTLTKNIPAGSGLGSASSDAAAALIGLNRFAELGVSEHVIADIAAGLGSDINFFLGGPLAFCTGRGEKIERISEKIRFSALLILSNVSVATKRVYANYSHDSDLYSRLSARINVLIEKKKIDSVAHMCANMLESSCFELHHELAELKSNVEASGIGSVCLSGSGSAMFCLVTNADEKIASYQSMLSNSFGCESVIVNNNRW
jgi:4-diphosphocytidyl-2-C-methyl-D-erythritol kinase